MQAISTPSLMDLSRRPVAPDLRPFVRAYVDRRDRAAFSAMRELPVPSPLIQIMLRSDFHFTKNGKTVTAPRAALWGPSSGAVQSRTEGPLHVFVVVLTYRGAAAFDAARQGGLADEQAPLENFLSQTSWRQFTRIYEATDVDSRVLAVEAWLRWTFQHCRPPDAATVMIDAILQHRLRGSVREMAEHAGISERGVHKRCERLIGWSPKRLLRITRLQRVLGGIHPSPWLAAADAVDARLEYADDSHLANDVRSLTGLTVSAYRAAKRMTGDQLIHTMVDPA